MITSILQQIQPTTRNNTAYATKFNDFQKLAADTVVGSKTDQLMSYVIPWICFWPNCYVFHVSLMKISFAEDCLKCPEMPQKPLFLIGEGGDGGWSGSLCLPLILKSQFAPKN